MNLKDTSILITGGTGSFGSAFIKHLIATNNIPKKIVVYSRDWQKQAELRAELNNPKFVKWVIGDVRDYKRLLTSFVDIDYVIHAAAIKDVTACEENPTECLETNVIGTQNVIDACIKNRVFKSMLISTDKAVLPINTYGTSKKMAEKLFINASTLFSKFAVCRYGNVIGSNGSVLPLYKRLIAKGFDSLPVTHEAMTRFWFPMHEAINFVLDSLENCRGGDLFIPKIPSIRITDLCAALDKPYHVIGIREGEKLHEHMIAPNEVTGDEGYSSGNNPHFLTIDEIRESIK